MQTLKENLGNSISIHALRGEGDLLLSSTHQRYRQFQSTPSVGRATACQVCPAHNDGISIHALRGEGDTGKSSVFALIAISIHALRGEGDRTLSPATPSKETISIHALRGEGDAQGHLWAGCHICISIHALRGEGDARRALCGNRDKNFNPRPPWGGRQSDLGELPGDIIISIHALRGEGDSRKRGLERRDRNFNPRPPWGGRLQKYTNMQCYACT